MQAMDWHRSRMGQHQMTGAFPRGRLSHSEVQLLHADGSLQGDATAVPANPFSTESSGNHTHTNGAFDRLLTHTGLSTAPGSDSTDSSGSEPDIIHSTPMITAGAHTHRIGGGLGFGG